MVSFPDAIKDNFARLTDFEGRSTRAQYWWWALFLYIIAIALSLIAVPLASGNDGVGIVVYSLYVVVGVVFFLASLAVAIRRMHDIGKSGWWILIQLIPCGIGFVWFLVLAVTPSNPGPNQYG